MDRWNKLLVELDGLLLELELGELRLELDVLLLDEGTGRGGDVPHGADL